MNIKFLLLREFNNLIAEYDSGLNRIILSEKQSRMTLASIVKQMEDNFRDTKQYIQPINVYDFKIQYQKNGGLLTFIAKTHSPSMNEYKMLVQFRGIKEYPFASDKTFEYKDPVTKKKRFIEKPDPQKHFVKVKSTSPDFIWRGQLACYHKGCLYGKVTKKFTTYKKKTDRPPYKTNALKIPILGKHLWGFIRTMMNDGYILKKWGK